VVEVFLSENPQSFAACRIYQAFGFFKGKAVRVRYKYYFFLWAFTGQQS
jgi:hypothetical protein